MPALFLQKAKKPPIEILRLLIRSVAKARIDIQLAAGDLRCQQPRSFRTHDMVLRPAQDQSGTDDLGKLRRSIEGEDGPGIGEKAVIGLGLSHVAQKRVQLSVFLRYVGE